jgi:hypothetical protein
MHAAGAAAHRKKKLTMSRFALANHVFVCLQGEHVVFLDVRNDRYFALEASSTHGLASFVAGWPVGGAEVAQGPGEQPRHADSREVPRKEALRAQALSILMEKGLLAPNEALGRDATPVRAEPSHTELVADAADSLPATGALAICRFLVAAITARMALRFVGLERVLARVRCRNEAARSNPNAFDVERARRLVEVFGALRPLFFTSKNQCLFEALALSEFLARYGLYPAWIFGVQARPFAAHCWLQQEGVLLNDTSDHVSRYTPILRV